MASGAYSGRRAPNDRSGEHAAIQQVIARLEAAYADRHSKEWIRAEVTAARHRFRNARVRNYVPILVERAARAALDNLEA
ncbi:hypothetical protein AB0O86_32005 [Streptomyces hirsutus]|uniref:three-helix bundle dimerization domain-containing protein n=1 Tax=Streptomyces hirsutus TaxID=35620 RepID=UPI003415EFB3